MRQRYTNQQTSLCLRPHGEQPLQPSLIVSRNRAAALYAVVAYSYRAGAGASRQSVPFSHLVKGDQPGSEDPPKVCRRLHPMSVMAGQSAWLSAFHFRDWISSRHFWEIDAAFCCAPAAAVQPFREPRPPGDVKCRRVFYAAQCTCMDHYHERLAMDQYHQPTNRSFPGCCRVFGLRCGRWLPVMIAMNLFRNQFLWAVFPERPITCE